MKEIKKEIKDAKEYIKGCKEEYNKTEPTKQWKLRNLDRRISEYEYYVMGLEFALKVMEGKDER